MTNNSKPLTEKEKMLSQQYYLCWDKTLAKDRALAKHLCYELNVTRLKLYEQRLSIINELFGNCGENTWVESPFNRDYGYNI